MYHFLQTMENSPELKYMLGYVSKSAGLTDPYEFIFNEDFLEDYYNAILKVMAENNIKITSIEHFNYLERYTFKHNNNEISIIDFYYNGKKQFTRSQPQNNSSIELSKLILSLLQ